MRKRRLGRAASQGGRRVKGAPQCPGSRTTDDRAAPPGEGLVGHPGVRDTLLTQAAIADHPRLLSRRASLEAAERSARVEQLVALPISPSSPATALDRLGADFFSAFVGIRLPLWAGRKQSRQAEAARADADAARAELAEETAALEAELEAAQAAVTSGEARLHLLTTQVVPSAAATVEAVLRSYQLGQAPFLNVLAAEDSLYHAELDAVMVAAEYPHPHRHARAAAAEGGPVKRPLIILLLTVGLSLGACARQERSKTAGMKGMEGMAEWGLRKAWSPAPPRLRRGRIRCPAGPHRRSPNRHYLRASRVPGGTARHPGGGNPGLRGTPAAVRQCASDGMGRASECRLCRQTGPEGRPVAGPLFARTGERAGGISLVPDVWVTRPRPSARRRRLSSGTSRMIRSTTLERTGTARRTLELRAPMSGEIAEKMVTDGQAVQPATISSSSPIGACSGWTWPSSRPMRAQ